MTRISVFGLGHVGLVSAVSFAKKGYRVVAVESDKHKLELIQRAIPPLHEPGLAHYLKKVIRNGSLKVTNDPSSTAESNLVYIAVGTPSSRDGSINLAYVENVAAAIGRSLRGTSRYALVIIKSTVTPGTARNIVQPTIEKESGKIAGRDFGLCSNPEFLREGRAFHDAEHPDRIVIGSNDPVAIRRLERFYKRFHAQHTPPIVRTTFENAELIKYASNALLATKLSLINSIAAIAERVPNADVKVVARGIGYDRRIGKQFLDAGLGWGGSCFPKDLNAIVAFSKSLGYGPELIEATIDTNNKQWSRAIELTERALGSLDGKRVAILGLAFKPDTDDMRGAVSIPLVKAILSAGANVVAYDPAAMENARAIFKKTIEYASNPVQCIQEADCCIVATEWNEFKNIRPSVFVREMRQPIVIDGRRIYDPTRFSKAEIRLSAIGLGPRESKRRLS